jgi:putative PIN family toxin of toxin-antitoxin system
MLVVLDTNVIVSGLLNGAGKPGKIIDLSLDDRFQIAYDDRILGEYEDVLARPELRLSPARVRAFIFHIELMGLLIDADPLPLEGFQDPGDAPFAEVFLTANADSLVTGNIRHFAPLIEKGLAVHTPAQFIENFFPEK